MARKITMKLGRSDTIQITVPDRTALPLATLKRLTLVWDGELHVSCNTPVGAGYGRSLRAIVLGLPYKSARRINRDVTSFLYEDFADPSGDKVPARVRR